MVHQTETVDPVQASQSATEALKANQTAQVDLLAGASQMAERNLLVAAGWTAAQIAEADPKAASVQAVSTRAGQSAMGDLRVDQTAEADLSAGANQLAERNLLVAAGWTADQIAEADPKAASVQAVSTPAGQSAMGDLRVDQTAEAGLSAGANQLAERNLLEAAGLTADQIAEADPKAASVLGVSIRAGRTEDPNQAREKEEPARASQSATGGWRVDQTAEADLSAGASQLAERNLLEAAGLTADRIAEAGPKAASVLGVSIRAGRTEDPTQAGQMEDPAARASQSVMGGLQSDRTAEAEK